jgi:organic hydroperoxide reductase OsmC/OhrA
MSEPSGEYYVKVLWTGKKSGRVLVQGRSEIKTGIPPEGEGTIRNYSPEELFVAAGAVCFMNSFVYFTEKMHIEFESFEVESTGYLEQIGRSYEITRIHSKTKLVIPSEELRSRFERALELGAKYCFVANSMRCPTTHEHVIDVRA